MPAPTETRLQMLYGLLTEAEASRLNAFGALLKRLTDRHGLVSIHLAYIAHGGGFFSATVHDKHEAFLGNRIYEGARCINNTAAEQIASAVRLHAAANPDELTRVRKAAAEAAERAEKLAAELAKLEAEAV